MARKENPTTTEVNAAIEAQAPMPRTTQGEDRPVTRVNAFAQLAKVSRDARLTYGGTAQWVQPETLFNAAYRDGLESVPFYVTRAWRYNSKQGYGERLGIEIVLANGRIYSVALGFKDGDSKRNDMLLRFEDRNAQPFGPLVLVKLDINKGNPYLDFQAFQSDDARLLSSGDTPDVPFVEITNDDVPF